MKTLFLLFALAMLTTGCMAHVPLAPPHADQQAKGFQPTQDTAGLYVVRSRIHGSAPIVFQVAVDGQVIGHLAHRTYLWLPLAPGPHTIVASSPENSARETVLLPPGQATFVAVEPRWGIRYVRVGLQLLDAAQGHQAIAKSRLAQRLDQ